MQLPWSRPAELLLGERRDGRRGHDCDRDLWSRQRGDEVFEFAIDGRERRAGCDAASKYRAEPVVRVCSIRAFWKHDLGDLSFLRTTRLGRNAPLGSCRPHHSYRRTFPPSADDLYVLSI